MLGETGPLVKVKWFDATNGTNIKKINIDDPSEHLSYCETVGELLTQDNNATIISYHYTDTSGIDLIAIPSQWILEIEELKCLENLESQPVSKNAKQLKNSKS